MAKILPVRGTTTEINNTPIIDGQILFETNLNEQNHIYMDIYDDTEQISKRISIGISDWDSIENKPFESIGTGLNVTNGVLNLDDPIEIDWDSIIDKPFETIGDGLMLVDDSISAAVPSIDFGWVGQASLSSSKVQRLDYTNQGYDYQDEINGTKYMEGTQTLNTNDDTYYYFVSDTDFSADSAFDIYTSIWGFRPNYVSVNEGTVTIGFPPYPNENTNMTCRLYII